MIKKITLIAIFVNLAIGNASAFSCFEPQNNFTAAKQADFLYDEYLSKRYSGILSGQFKKSNLGPVEERSEYIWLTDTLKLRLDKNYWGNHDLFIRDAYFFDGLVIEKDKITNVENLPVRFHISCETGLGFCTSLLPNDQNSLTSASVSYDSAERLKIERVNVATYACPDYDFHATKAVLEILKAKIIGGGK